MHIKKSIPSSVFSGDTDVKLWDTEQSSNKMKYILCNLLRSEHHSTPHNRSYRFDRNQVTDKHKDLDYERYWVFMASLHVSDEAKRSLSQR